MGKKLFVSNLDFEIDNETLRSLFADVGSCISAVVALDRETKRSRGFGFVEMEDDQSAAQAIEALNGKPVNGRPIKVVEDRGKTGDRQGGGDGEGAEGGRRFEFLPAIQRTQLFKRKKRLDPFLEDPTKTVDYKDVATLTRFLSERGKLLSRRLTGLTAYNQRKVAKALKRAQHLGLTPFTSVKPL